MPIRDNAPSYATPWVTIALIFANVVAFVMQLMHPGGFEQSVYTWGEIPKNILSGQKVMGTDFPAWVTMFTSMFLHGGFEHIIGNMWSLWLFGDNVEWLLGRARYFVFYIACGFLANVATVFLGYESDMPGVGASGAIAGVMAAYLIFYPRARITSLIFARPYGFWHAMTGEVGFIYRNISAYYFIGWWILLQIVISMGMIMANVNLNLGLYAHAAGALSGAGLVWALVIRDRIPSPDHPSRCAPLTSMIIGDAGAAGEENSLDAYGMPLDQEILRLRLESRAEAHDYTAAISDDYLDDLIERGEYAAALRHAKDMRKVAEDEKRLSLLRAYGEIIGRLERKVRGESSEPWDWKSGR